MLEVNTCNVCTSHVILHDLQKLCAVYKLIRGNDDHLTCISHFSLTGCISSKECCESCSKAGKSSKKYLHDWLLLYTINSNSTLMDLYY